jgi:hypothetical protein
MWRIILQILLHRIHISLYIGFSSTVVPFYGDLEMICQTQFKSPVAIFLNKILLSLGAINHIVEPLWRSPRILSIETDVLFLYYRYT